MANANAVIIRKAKLYPRPSLHNLLHNSGLILATYWIKSVVNIKQAPKIKNQEEAIKIWDKWIIILRERYKKNNKNKRELRSDAIIIEEGLIVIGRDVVANENQIIQISNDFIKKFEQDNNTNILHASYHNHEGHIDNDEKEVINRHIHFLFANVSKDGKMIRRNWKRDYLKKLQDDIYEISKKYIQNIERGKEAKYEQKNINGKIVNENIKKHIHPRKLRYIQEQETLRNKLIKENEATIENKNTEIEKLMEKIKYLKRRVDSRFKFKNTEKFLTYKFLYISFKKKYIEHKNKFREKNNIIKKISKYIQKHQYTNDQNIDILDFIKQQNYNLQGLDNGIKKIIQENYILTAKLKSLETNLNRIDIKNNESKSHDQDINNIFNIKTNSQQL